MPAATDLHSVPLISNAAACVVFAGWAAEHGVRRHGALVTLHTRGPRSEAIYFATPIDIDTIKIGCSTRPVRRVREQRAPNGSALLLRVVLSDFGLVDEETLHSLLSEFSTGRYRRSGHYEFYRGETPIADLMRRMIAAAEACLSDRYRVPCPRRASSRAA